MIPIVSKQVLEKFTHDAELSGEMPELDTQIKRIDKDNPWLSLYISSCAMLTSDPQTSVLHMVGLINLLERAEKENVFANMVVREDKNGQT